MGGPGALGVSTEQQQQWRALIEQGWINPDSLRSVEFKNEISLFLQALERGFLRCAGPLKLGPDCGPVAMDDDLRTWQVHEWVKKGILLALKTRVAVEIGVSEKSNGAPCYFDKLGVRSDFSSMGARVVPPGVVREGAHVQPGVIVMPGYVNVGAFVSAGTMVDTWATVGSCAQVGRHVHLSGGVGLGGVLEPAHGRPVMIGDHAFIGSRCIVVEGAVVSTGAVLGANVCITSSTPIYDVTTPTVSEHRGYVPPHAVVVPGTRPKKFPGGEVHIQCAYIIAYRSAATDAKVSLNDVLRETGIPV